MSKELEAFLEYLAVVKLLNTKTIDAYRADILSMERFLEKPAIEFSSDDIIKYISQQKTPATKNRKLSALNSFYKFCLKEDFLDEKPSVDFAKLEKKLPRYMLWEELSSHLKMIDKSTWIGKRDYAFLLFLYATGARVSEALSVKRDDFEGEWIKFRNTKRDKERIVPIAKVALIAIEEYLNSITFKSEYIWLNYQGNKLSRISAFKIVKKYLGIYPHALRHSYATELILGGSDLRVVQELLGHSSLVTTSIYTHIENEELKKTLFEHHPLAREK